MGVSPLRLHVPVWSDADLVSHPSLAPLTVLPILPMEPELGLVHEEESKCELKTGLEAQLPGSCQDSWEISGDGFTVSVGWDRDDREQHEESE